MILVDLFNNFVLKEKPGTNYTLKVHAGNWLNEGKAVCENRQNQFPENIYKWLQDDTTLKQET